MHRGKHRLQQMAAISLLDSTTDHRGLLGVTVLRVSLGRMRIDQAFRFFLKWPLALSVLSLAIVAFA